MIKKLDNIVFYLISIFPVLIVSGPFLSDTAVVLIDLIFLYIIIKENKLSLLNNIYFKYFLFFCLYFSVRSIFTDDILFSLKSSFFYIRFIILVFAISFFLDRNDKLISLFSKIFLVTILIVCIDGLFQYLFGFNFLGFKIDNEDKLSGLFGDEAVLGSFLVRLTPLVFAVLYRYFNQRENKSIFLFSLILLELLIFLSGSRTSLFLMLFFSGIFFLINNSLRKSIIIIHIIIIISVFSLSKFNSRFSHTAYYAILDPIRTMFFEESKDVAPKNFLIEKPESVENRKFFMFTRVYDSHYRTAYNMFLDNKFFGVGTKMFRQLCGDPKYWINEFSCSTHPHNFYVQILAENGIFGFIALIIPFIYITFIVWKILILHLFKNKKIRSYSALMILTGIFLNLWPIISSGNFFNNWLSILIYFPVGFYQYFNKKNELH